MNSHHHSEPQEIDNAVKMMKKYWFLQDTYKFTTDVREIDDKWVRLHENYFYPEGGGQPSDRGKLLSQKGVFNVTNVQEIDKKVWLKLDHLGLEEGDEIRAEINKHRRETLTRNHSGQHLLSAAFWEELEIETIRALIDMEETEIELENSPDLTDVREILSLCQEKIQEKLPIETTFYNQNEISELNLRGSLPETLDLFRIVEIGNYDRNACGGTHVENTAEIEIILVTKIEGKKIKFTTGTIAKSKIPNINLELFRTSRILGAPINNLSSVAADLITTKENMSSELIELKNKYTKLKVKNANWENVSNIPLKIVDLHEINRGFLVDLFNEIESPFLSLIIDKSRKFVLISHSSDLTQDLMQFLKKNGIKGGGRGKVVMGKTESKDKIVKIVKNFLVQN